jgi:L-lactate utilization protein LutB
VNAARPGDRRPVSGAGASEPDRRAGASGAAASPGLQELLASLRQVRKRARAGLLEEALGTMAELGFQVARPARNDIADIVREIIPVGANVVYHPCVVGRAIRVDEMLRAEGRHVVTLPGDGESARQNGSWREHLLAAEYGITGATALVADTGSLVLAEELGFGRAASNVPPVHIALITPDSVVETVLDAAVMARAYAALHLHQAVPRYLSFISGPSKTADIGFTLVRGMHGPRTVRVLIWDGVKAVGNEDAALRDWVLP